jgi:hypothetical protein
VGAVLGLLRPGFAQPVAEGGRRTQGPKCRIREGKKQKNGTPKQLSTMRNRYEVLMPQCRVSSGVEAFEVLDDTPWNHVSNETEEEK